MLTDCLVINKPYSSDLTHNVGGLPNQTGLFFCFIFSRNGIQLNVSGEHKCVNSEGEKSLLCELVLAQSAKVGNYNQMEVVKK